MACELWLANLDAYLDGELQGADELALREHLKTCPTCAAQALDRIQVKRSVQAAAMRFRPDPAFRARVRQSIAPASAPYRKWQWTALFAVAAASLLLVAVLLNRPQLGSRNTQLAGELVDLHVAALASANPVDVVSTDRHTVKPWFEGKIPFTFDLPELQGSPFSLIGGRTAYLHQSVGAHLIFRIRQHNLSVFIFPAAAGGSCRDATADTLNFHLRSWPHNGLCYFVVGDVGSDDLDKLAALLRT